MVVRALLSTHSLGLQPNARKAAGGRKICSCEGLHVGYGECLGFSLGAGLCDAGGLAVCVVCVTTRSSVVAGPAPSEDSGHASPHAFPSGPS